MKILIAEDENQKLEHICEFVKANFAGADVLIAKSVTAAIDALEDHSPDLLMLDMSLPTFEIGVDEPGGRPQGFGGIEILRHADFLGAFVPTFVITAYEGFEDGSRAVDLSELRHNLEQEHPRNFKGIVYYSGLGGEWSSELSILIRSAGLMEEEN